MDNAPVRDNGVINGALVDLGSRQVSGVRIHRVISLEEIERRHVTGEGQVRGAAEHGGVGEGDGVDDQFSGEICFLNEILG